MIIDCTLVGICDSMDDLVLSKSNYENCIEYLLNQLKLETDQSTKRIVENEISLILSAAEELESIIEIVRKGKTPIEGPNAPKKQDKPITKQLSKPEIDVEPIHEWKTDALSFNCKSCKNEFHLFLRKHHCR